MKVFDGSKIIINVIRSKKLCYEVQTTKTIRIVVLLAPLKTSCVFAIS